MLEINFIRENKDLIVDSLSKRNIDSSSVIESVIDVDAKKRKIQTELDNILHQSNLISKEIGDLFKQGHVNKASVLKEKTVELKEASKKLNEELNSVKSNLQQLLYKIPNIPHHSVPKGKSEEDNVEIMRGGELPNLPKGSLPHWDLAKKYDIIDFELGNKITGAGFPVYKGKGAKLQRALISFFLDMNTQAGYNEVQVPHLINEKSAFGTGQLPDKEGMMYYIQEDNLYLIPTAEVPATNIFRDEIIAESNLPKLLTSYTPCFRREAGSYGSHVRGLNRLHQFDKVEILRVEHPDKSYEALDGMVDHVKSIINKLNLPFRILKLCGSDLGFTSCLTFDFELFSAGQNKWLEVSSVSNFETFQANRLKLRYKNSSGKTQLAHTLNGSSLALPRVLATLIENNQTSKGIVIPEVLVPYTGFSIID
ncbi:MAG: Serine--tRNA ligase [Flavobacteriaceae bacterium]|nr:MAG: Serine--tRNA ligase [Flavobacteriaceae bacterium]|tara:strand:+ start:2182 stop:3453 length:1272 start_codon:yes stop_codon:yes gene_type:complete